MRRAMPGQPKSAEHERPRRRRWAAGRGTCRAGCRRSAGCRCRDSASSIRVGGNDSVRSMKRPMTASIQPPVKPAMMPSTAPTTIAISVADSAIASEKVMPYQSRDSTSRPVPGSTPSGWSQLMPPKLADRAGRRSTGRSGPGGSVVRVEHPELHQERRGDRGQRCRATTTTNEIIESLSWRNRSDREPGRGLARDLGGGLRPRTRRRRAAARSPGWRPGRSWHLCRGRN